MICILEYCFSAYGVIFIALSTFLILLVGMRNLNTRKKDEHPGSLYNVGEPDTFPHPKVDDEFVLFPEEGSLSPKFVVTHVHKDKKFLIFKVVIPVPPGHEVINVDQDPGLVSINLISPQGNKLNRQWQTPGYVSELQGWAFDWTVVESEI